MVSRMNEHKKEKFMEDEFFDDIYKNSDDGSNTNAFGNSKKQMNWEWHNVRYQPVANENANALGSKVPSKNSQVLGVNSKGEASGSKVVNSKIPSPVRSARVARVATRANRDATKAKEEPKERKTCRTVLAHVHTLLKSNKVEEALALIETTLGTKEPRSQPTAYNMFVKYQIQEFQKNTKPVHSSEYLARCGQMWSKDDFGKYALKRYSALTQDLGNLTPMERMSIIVKEWKHVRETKRK